MVKSGILLFEDVEVLDFAGPFEVLSTAARQPGVHLITETVGLRPEVVCRGGLVVKPSRLLSEEPLYDLLIVPGGPGARAMVAAVRASAATVGPETFAAEANSIIRCVMSHARKGAIVASVCTGAYFLAEAGLLAGRRTTTHRAAFEPFRQTYPDVQLVSERYVDLGQVLTSGGVSAGIDMALHLVARLFGPPVRRAVAAVLEWEQVS